MTRNCDDFDRRYCGRVNSLAFGLRDHESIRSLTMRIAVSTNAWVSSAMTAALFCLGSELAPVHLKIASYVRSSISSKASDAFSRVHLTLIDILPRVVSMPRTLNSSSKSANPQTSHKCFSESKYEGRAPTLSCYIEIQRRWCTWLCCWKDAEN